MYYLLATILQTVSAAGRGALQTESLTNCTAVEGEREGEREGGRDKLSAGQMSMTILSKSHDRSLRCTNLNLHAIILS